MEMIKRRTIGVEMEGYVDENPEGRLMGEMEAFDCQVGHDESLNHSNWGGNSDRYYYDDDDDHDDDDDCNGLYGVEIRTSPFKDLGQLTEIINTLHSRGWSVNNQAGTHIHVDISDYTEKDMAKLLRFGKGIERIIFMYTEDYRNGNGYCKSLPNEWRKIFWKNSNVGKAIDIENMRDGISLYDHIRAIDNRRIQRSLTNYKYHWMNIFDSNYSTVEFRLFNAMRISEEVIGQANLAYSIVELVKHSSPEQLEFILKTIYSAPTVREVAERFMQALGIEEGMPIIGDKAYRYLERKIERVENESELQAI